jgi:transcription elongation factor Elf1
MAEHKSKSAFPFVECPGCRRPMRVVSTEPIAGARNIATYHCDKCGMETERIFKVDDKG